jgi:hypothetical protein
MFLVAETERNFRPLPEIALRMLANTWDKAMLERFARLLVWPVVRQRIVTDERIQGKLSQHCIELDGVPDVDSVMPEILVEGSFLVPDSRELYPFLWYALNAAMQHSAVNQLIHQQRAKISIKYDQPRARVIVENTGEAPHIDPDQPGWTRDLNIINGLRDRLPWKVVSVNGQHSVYKDGVWITEIERIIGVE